MAKRSSWLILRDSIIPTGPIRTSFERSQTGSLKPISSGSGLLALSICTELSTFALGIKNLRMSRKLCGEQGLGSVVLATTMWSLCLAADASRREELERLKEKHDKEMREIRQEMKKPSERKTKRDKRNSAKTEPRLIAR
jgi:hypothetical protein